MPLCPLTLLRHQMFTDAVRADLEEGCSWLTPFKGFQMPESDAWTLNDKSEDECKEACEKRRLTDVCRSFDYIKDERKCHLSREDRYDNFIVETNNHIYHEIVCEPGKFLKLHYILIHSFK